MSFFSLRQDRRILQFFQKIHWLISHSFIRDIFLLLIGKFCSFFYWPIRESRSLFSTTDRLFSYFSYNPLTNFSFFTTYCRNLSFFFWHSIDEFCNFKICVIFLLWIGKFWLFLETDWEGNWGPFFFGTDQRILWYFFPDDPLTNFRYFTHDQLAHSAIFSFYWNWSANFASIPCIGKNRMYFLWFFWWSTYEFHFF